MLFRILGPLEVQVNGEWSGVTAPKWRTVLAVLLLNPGQVVSTDRLIGELWPGDPPARATNLVSVYVHRLRRLLGDADGRILVTHSPGYLLLAGAEDVDAQRFTRLVGEGRSALAGGGAKRAASLLGEALSLWRGGRALADVPSSALIGAEAAGLEESRIEAVELRIQADLECGRDAQIVPELNRLLADHPIRERMWALLIRALCGGGRQAEALEAYARAREVIADELGVDPGPELQHLYEQILTADAHGEVTTSGATSADGGSIAGAAQEVPAPAAPPLPQLAQLPADIIDFTGRAEHVRCLRRLLTEPQRPDSPGAVSVAAVIGAGGLGKTTLAVHTAHQLRGQFPDGQLYANLHGASAHPVPPGDVLARFLRDLGVDPAAIPAGEEERAAQYRSHLTDRRVLIVLDDARDAAQIRPLLPGSAACAVLVTTRSHLPELAGSHVIDLDVLESAEAHSMFAGIIGARRAEAEPEATEEVLAACAGLPLAIRIAGARLAARSNWTVRSLASRLSDQRRRLDELKTGDLAVRTCFEVSFASLPKGDLDGVDPAQAFRLLGLWQGSSIALPAAAALLGRAELDVADALEVLVDAHLLDSPVPDVYRFHDLLKAYAADRARVQEAEQDRADAITRVLAWYLHTVEAAARVISPQHTRVPLDPPPPEVRPLEFSTLNDALSCCEAERAHLMGAVRLAAESGRHDMAWKLAAVSMSFFYRRSHWTDWVTTHQFGLCSARQLQDKQAEAWMLNNLGMAYGQQRMKETIGCFEQALALYKELGDARGEARAATNVANSYLELRRFEEALEAARLSLALQRQAGKRYGEGIALGNLGCAHRELAQYDEAIDCLQQALAIFRELNDPDSEADSLSDLGAAYLGCGRMEHAVDSLRQALAIRRDIGDRYGQALTLHRLGLTQQRAGNLSEARELLSEALQLLEDLGGHSQSAEIQANLMAFGQT